MQNNHFVQVQVANSLNRLLKNAVLNSVFTQTKDEIVLEWLAYGSYFYVQAILKAEFTSLHFPENYNRKRSNTVDLFPQLYGCTFKNSYSPPNERALVIELGNNTNIVFTYFRPMPNVYVFTENTVTDKLYKKATDLDGALLRGKPFEGAIGGISTLEQAQAAFPALGKELLAELTTNYNSSKLQQILSYLAAPDYYIIQTTSGIKFSLLKLPGIVLFQTKDVVEALAYFVPKYLYHVLYTKQKAALLKTLSDRITHTQATIIQLKKRIADLHDNNEFSRTADLLMANLHLVKQGATEIKVHNFYTDKEQVIKLNPLLTAQKQAEKLYSKAKNKEIELKYASLHLARKEEELIQLKQEWENAQNISNLKEIQKSGFNQKTEKIQSQAPSPCKEYVVEGWKILVGRNAKNNEVVTFSLAKKDDLWLHARDVSGSHVVIKQKPNTKFPKHIIEIAASLAAYYSKSKTEKLATVAYTERKWVRKVKGGHPGQVLVDKETVILVEPKNLEEV